jgi:cell division protein FtsN
MNNMKAVGGKRAMGGGTLLGFLVGLILGLAVAVAVAIFVTKAPVPFVNKVSKGERVNEVKSPADAPDPNKPLYGKQKPPAPPPEPVAAPSSPVNEPATGSPSAPSAPVVASAPSVALPPSTTSAPNPEEKIAYLLQAGAFRSQDDADMMKAKLAMMGLEARILTAEVKGETLYRVRVGPYSIEQDAAKARAKLADNGIEATVVRQR